MDKRLARTTRARTPEEPAEPSPPGVPGRRIRYKGGAYEAPSFSPFPPILGAARDSVQRDSHGTHGNPRGTAGFRPRPRGRGCHRGTSDPAPSLYCGTRSTRRTRAARIERRCGSDPRAHRFRSDRGRRAGPEPPRRRRVAPARTARRTGGGVRRPAAPGSACGGRPPGRSARRSPPRRRRPVPGGPAAARR